MWKPKFEAENDDHNVAKSQNCYQKFTFWRHFQCFIILVAYYNKSLTAMKLVHESWLSSWLLGHSLLLLACLLSFWGLGGGYKVQAKFCPMLQLLLPLLAIMHRNLIWCESDTTNLTVYCLQRIFWCSRSKDIHFFVLNRKTLFHKKSKISHSKK